MDGVQEYDGNASLVHNGTQGDWATWLADMNGAKVTVYVTNCGNGTTNIAVMEGTSGTSYAQYYLGINKVDMNDLNFALTIEGGHRILSRISNHTNHAVFLRNQKKRHGL